MGPTWASLDHILQTQENRKCSIWDINHDIRRSFQIRCVTSQNYPWIKVLLLFHGESKVILVRQLWSEWNFNLSMTSFLENNFKTHLLLLILIRPIEIFVGSWLACCVDTITMYWEHQHTNYSPLPTERAHLFLTPHSIQLIRLKSNHTKRFNFTGASHHFPESRVDISDCQREERKYF